MHTMRRRSATPNASRRSGAAYARRTADTPRAPEVMEVAAPACRCTAPGIVSLAMMNWWMSVVKPARAAPRLTPGRNRPSSRSQEVPRSSMGALCGRITGCMLIGSQRSTGRSVKPGGVTPMIVRRAPSTSIARPMTSVAPPNRRRKYPSLTTATGDAPTTRSSSAVKTRPRAAPTPSTSK